VRSVVPVATTTTPLIKSNDTIKKYSTQHVAEAAADAAAGLQQVVLLIPSTTLAA